MDEASTPPPFRAGDLVRVRDGKRNGMRKYRRGVVVRCQVPPCCENPDGTLHVLVDRNTPGKWNKCRWFLPEELVSEADVAVIRDHTADLLIRAYQDGDRDALRPLVDRLLEIL